MGLDNLLYYILNLIVEGHRWQYQNATCSNKPPRLYFTTFQWVALGLALVFVLTKPSGLNNDIIDYLLSSLSIMTGFFLALVVVVYEKHIGMDFKSDRDDERINDFKSWNYLRQFNALTSYAILISVIVIAILIGSLLFGHETHFSKYCLAANMADIDWLLTTRLVIVVFVRFILVYFLLDFFILAVYAITSLFQFVNVKMNEKQPLNPLGGVRVLTDKETLKRQYPHLSVIAKITILMTLVALVLYELEPICCVFMKLWLMFFPTS